MTQFIGTTTECVRHYFEGVQDNENDPKNSALAEFLKIPYAPTIRRWMLGEIAPIGQLLIKVRYFLQSQGYVVTELVALDPEVALLGKWFAYGEMTIDEVATVLGYSSTTGRIIQTLVVLRGESAPAGSKMRRIKRFIAARAPSAAVVPLKAPPHRAPHKASAAVRGNTHGGRTQDTPHLHEDGRAMRVLLMNAANDIANLTRVAEFLVSPECTEEDRAQLHELAGPDGVLTLIARLAPLCSETAFRKHAHDLIKGDTHG